MTILTIDETIGPKFSVKNGMIHIQSFTLAVVHFRPRTSSPTAYEAILHQLQCVTSTHYGLIPNSVGTGMRQAH